MRAASHGPGRTATTVCARQIREIRSKGGRSEASTVSSRLRESNAGLLVFVGVVRMQMIAPRVKRAFLDGDLLSEYMTQVELLGNVIASAGFGLVLVN